MEELSDVSRSLSRLVEGHRAADADAHRDHVLRFLAEAKDRWMFTTGLGTPNWKSCRSGDQDRDQLRSSEADA